MVRQPSSDSSRECSTKTSSPSIHAGTATPKLSTHFQTFSKSTRTSSHKASSCKPKSRKAHRVQPAFSLKTQTATRSSSTSTCRCSYFCGSHFRLSDHSNDPLNCHSIAQNFVSFFFPQNAH